MAREPASAFSFAEDVVSHAVAGGGRVDDTIVADVDRDVIDVIAVVREEEQVARSERAGSRRHRITEIGHPTRAVRESDALAPEDPLYKARAVEAVVRARAVKAIARPDVLVGRRQHARRQTRVAHTGLDGVARWRWRHVDASLDHRRTWRVGSDVRAPEVAAAAEARGEPKPVLPASRRAH